MIDYFSYTSVPLKIISDRIADKRLYGTVFFYNRNSKIYLITNLHNLTGESPKGDRCASPNRTPPNCLIPSGITFEYYPETGKEGGKELLENIPLQHNGSNIWRRHKENKEADIAVIPFETILNIIGENKPEPCTIKEEKLTRDMKVSIGMDVFVLGFPIRSNFTNIYPIWKRGTIASEPSILVNGSYLLIDTATDQGMSGSPVVLRSYGGYVAHGVSWKVDRDNSGSDSCTQFLGIYSGSYNSDTKNDALSNAKLGVVWYKELIDQIIDDGV